VQRGREGGEGDFLPACSLRRGGDIAGRGERSGGGHFSLERILKGKLFSPTLDISVEGKGPDGGIIIRGAALANRLLGVSRKTLSSSVSDPLLLSFPLLALNCK